jgi:Flp pilus assembly protein TadG
VVSKAAVSAHARTTGFRRDRCGAVAVAVAVLLPVLIGFAGLGVEVGMWFWIQRQNQSAADAAAISAALEYAAQIESGANTNPTAAATTTANYNLFSTNSPNTLTVYPCYGFTVGSSCNTSSANGTFPNAVQVALIQPLNTTFANIVTSIWGPNINVVNVTTAAIAAFPMLSGGQTCLLALGSGNPPSGNTFSAATSATVNMPHCSLASLSTSGNSIQLGNLTINAAAVATAGNIAIDSGSSASLPPQTHTNFPLQDPYKSVAASFNAPAAPGPCVNWSVGTPILPRTYYCKGITINGSANVTFGGGGGTYYIGPPGINMTGSPTVTFSPGLYYIYGGSFSITGLTGGSISGSGVTFALTASSGGPAGNIVIDPGAACSGTVSLSGPQTGQGLLPPSPTASQGLLFFQDPAAVTSNTPNPNIISGCATPNVTLNGAIYTPATVDQLQGNFANVKGCTELISQSFTLSGNLAVDDTGCSGITLNQAQIQQVYLAM